MPSFLSSPRARLLLGGALLVVLLSFWKLSESSGSSYLPILKSSKPNAAIFILLAPNRITQALVALQNVEDRFNRRLKYPIILFTAEDEAHFITEDIKAKASHITNGRASFATATKESWDIPAWMDEKRVNSSLETIGFSTGYRAMCRYYSGFFWKNPALVSYEWLWRLDTDIQFHCDVPYDPIEVLISKKALYGFVQVNYDVSWVQPSLASNVSQFLSNNRHLIPADANQHFVWKGDAGVAKAMAGTAGNDDWTGACMYNNFEISHRSVWESSLYTKFFDHLEKAGGFFYERWGDSPVHSYGLAMSLRKDQIVQFDDLGYGLSSSEHIVKFTFGRYQHQGWAYECPKLDRCACIEDDDTRDFNNNGDAWFKPTM
ncbi:O-glycoside alpha-1,2-mannosyltransferase-like protein 3 [Psilocybe cubensis]|uniref:Glycosyltransferase family 15 protein n=2 Tax=Psilocybe cubensis TaxID=181762 RepID=A0A8H7XNC9_PSICU|nr:O-glycoside alpha-1,2-mannosyltransferase-like protein 3 [Psilocybe cubensis]KAH9475579.1 O-glycoside alpha-1,2-mannosyltransferase-like protein 3 [Psilocybe cubensis]